MARNTQSWGRLSQFGLQCGSALVGDVDQIVVDARLAPLLPVGLESPADLIDPAGHFDIQAVEVVAGSVTHLDSVLGPRCIACWPSALACRGQTTTTDFEDDVRFACDCDIASANCEFAGPRLFIAFLGPAARIDDDTALARRQNRY